MFFDLIEQHANCDDIALIDASTARAVSYRDLNVMVDMWAEQLRGEKELVFHSTTNSILSVASLLGALRAGHAVALVNPDLLPSRHVALLDAYQPSIVITPARNEQPTVLTDVLASSGTYMLHKNDHVWRATASSAQHLIPINPHLQILLSTSGSTGSPKFVRLSQAAVAHNAKAIAKALNITKHDKAYGHLPLHYSYGLSVLTSHLVVGASIILTENGPMQSPFWSDLGRFEISHFPGVPFHYQTMLKLGFKRLKLPIIATMTQAGGRLDPSSQELVWQYQASTASQFYVMYGQTEAAPRITTLPHSLLPSHLGSVGPSLQDGILEIVDGSGNMLPQGQSGSVIYSGPNVMLGYAIRRDDLNRGDDNGGKLVTGDLGYLDRDGCLFITGRTARIAKVAGVRVSLDELEHAISGLAAIVQSGEKLAIIYADNGVISGEAMRQALFEQFGIAPPNFKLVAVDCIPVRENGKIDYQKIETLIV